MNRGGWGEGRRSQQLTARPLLTGSGLGSQKSALAGTGILPRPCQRLSFPVLGSDPYIHVKGYDAGWIQLVCRSVGWFPRPWAEWRDPQGRVLPSEPQAPSLDHAGLFETAVSSKVRDSTVGSVSCTVRNDALGQEKTAAMVIAGKAGAENRLEAPGGSRENSYPSGNFIKKFLNTKNSMFIVENFKKK